VYTDGSTAYQLSWKVRTISWPDGKVIGDISLTGSPPPKIKSTIGIGSGSGEPPYAEFARWVFSQVEHPDFIYLDNGITSLAISPDGRIAAIGTSIASMLVDPDYQAKIILIDPLNLQIISTLEGHKGMVSTLAFSPDGKILASGGFDQIIRFWNLESGSLIGQVSVADSPESLAFSPDGKKLVVIFPQEMIFIDTSSMQITNSFQDIGGKKLAFSPDGNYIYVHSFLNMDVIDSKTGAVIYKFPDPLTLVPTFSITESGDIPDITYESPSTMGGFALSPDGNNMITYSDDPSQGISNYWLANWDPGTGKYLNGIKFTSPIIKNIEYSPDGSFLATGNGGEIWLWDATNLQVIKKLLGHTNFIVDMGFTPDGKNLLSAGLDGTVRIWNLGQ